jgi:hypothetical protein
MFEKLTAHQAADTPGYHVNHVYRSLRSGRMADEQFNRTWIIDPDELEQAGETLES